MRDPSKTAINEIIRQERRRRGWTQERLAEAIGISVMTVKRWESGKALPQSYSLTKLSELFEKSIEELGISPDNGSIVPPRVWNIPFHRNPFFTGREEIITRLREALTSNQVAALNQPQGLVGLGGIGKTQIAVEYAYRYQHDYQAVLWIQVDSHEAIVSDFVIIAHTLDLPEKDERDQSRAVNAVLRWLRDHTHWLLIFDNVENVEMIKAFIPPAYRGHIILTTRTHTLGPIARRIEVEQMGRVEGALFLLRRTSLIALDSSLQDISHDDLAQAEAISTMMDGLPLALDQAGAFIEETACSLSGYMELYRQQQSRLLKARGNSALNYPASVATTWYLSFEKVTQANAGAAELLKFCAFLAPDSIPEELIATGASHLGPVLAPIASDPLKLDMVIGELRKYSLLRRNPREKTLSIHRLVQAILQDGMNEEARHQWAERAVQAVNFTFPEVSITVWPDCERYLPHAVVCEAHIEQWNVTSLAAAELLDKAGKYLYERGLYAYAEPFLRRSLTISEHSPNPSDIDIAKHLNDLALLHNAQGKYEQAESLLRRALAIVEQALGPSDAKTAEYLNNLSVLYQNQGKYEQAESLLRRALAIVEQNTDHDHPSIAVALNNLALLYRSQGKYEQAEPLLEHALAINEQALGYDHPHVAITLNNLGLLDHVRGKDAQAELLFKRALAIWKDTLGTEHPTVAICLNNLATLYQAQGKYTEAEPLLQRALMITEQKLGPAHPSVKSVLDNLAELYKVQGKHAEAESLYQRAQTIYGKALDLESDSSTITGPHNSQDEPERPNTSQEETATGKEEPHKGVVNKSKRLIFRCAYCGQDTKIIVDLPTTKRRRKNISITRYCEHCNRPNIVSVPDSDFGHIALVL